MFLTYNHTETAERFLKSLPVRPDIDGLRRLTREFLRFPYENFTKIIRANTAASPDERYRLPDIIWNEHEAYGAGGTCFSLTYFFETILRHVGFDCYTVMVDRSYGDNTHCALIVRLGGQKLLVDPGYCLSEPILLTDREMTFKLPHNTYILSPAGESRYQLTTSQLGTRKSRYLLKDSPVTPDEFLKHWDASFNWPMMRHLCITRLAEDGYLYLRDDFLRHTTETDKKQERIKSGYDKRVTEVFGLSPEIVKLASDIIITPHSTAGVE